MFDVIVVGAGLLAHPLRNSHGEKKSIITRRYYRMRELIGQLYGTITENMEWMQAETLSDVFTPP